MLLGKLVSILNGRDKVALSRFHLSAIDDYAPKAVKAGFLKDFYLPTAAIHSNNTLR